MLEIRCSGTPSEVKQYIGGSSAVESPADAICLKIGRHHGSAARNKVLGSIAFYKNLFQTTCELDWPSVRNEASYYTETLERICPEYLDEMRGVAEGAGVDLLDILALNARTEIVFGLFVEKPQLPTKVDGCTSVALKTASGSSLLAQNWDWMAEQAPNLLVCYVSRPGTNIPDFTMVTEGGVIGKIGLNDRGVGVCLNAIRARGVDKSRLPVHLGLRRALESKSRVEAISRLKEAGIAGSAHILVADTDGATGLECTSKGVEDLEMDDKGQVVHSNHLLLEHLDVDEPPWLRDSPVRVVRMNQLLDETRSSGEDITAKKLYEMFKDQEGYPCSINRAQIGESSNMTVFNIVMELSKKRADVKFGRPTEDGESIQLVL